MSLRVDFAELPSHIMARGGGFLLTSVLDSRPHAAHLGFQIAAAEGQVELRAEVGRTSWHNCLNRPSVTVLWPAIKPHQPGTPANAEEPETYSLIVDGEARCEGDGESDRHVIITVTSAILHRPAGST